MADCLMTVEIYLHIAALLMCGYAVYAITEGMDE